MHLIIITIMCEIHLSMFAQLLNIANMGISQHICNFINIENHYFVRTCMCNTGIFQAAWRYTDIDKSEIPN